MSIEVLVVDEDEDVLDITETFLERQGGLSVSTETDPETALDRVVDGEFEAVVSDLTMPKMDGITLCQKLREAGSEVPFLLFTGRAASDVEGADDDCLTGFVRKGTGTDQYESLAEHIREAVE